MKPSNPSRELSDKLFPIASLFFCIFSVFLALGKLDYPLIGIDDANIYFVYAKNLANGHGFVYNAGGERVEGFTSLLWALVCTLASKFTAHPELTLLIVNIALVSLGIACAVYFLNHSFSHGEEKRPASLLWALLYLVLIFSSARYVVWNTITLMENALWSTLLLVTTLLVIRRDLSSRLINTRFIPLAILLLLTRPESNLWVIVFILVLFLRITFQNNFVTAIKILAPTLAGVVLTVVLLTLFRLSYFGYPFPNTYYAKVSPLLAYNIQQGVGYLSRYSLSDPVVTLCIMAIVIAILRALISVSTTKRLSSEGSFFLPFIACVGLLSPVLVGGDHFGSFRMFQNIYPIEVLSLLVFVNQILYEYSSTEARFKVNGWGRRGFSSVLMLILAAGIFQSQWSIWNLVDLEVGVEFQFAEYGRKSGAYIQNSFSGLSELPSLGVVSSGGIKYAYDGPVIDLLGLNNTTMAHNQGDRLGIKDHAAFDIPTFYQLHPDIVVPATIVANGWQYSESQLQESWENRYGFKGLFDETHFRELYTYAKVSRNADEQYAIIGWFDKDLLNEIRANGNFQIEEYRYSPGTNSGRDGA